MTRSIAQEIRDELSYEEIESALFNNPKYSDLKQESLIKIMSIIEKHLSIFELLKDMIIDLRNKDGDLDDEQDLL